MEFSDSNIYNIIASYIQVSDITECVMSDTDEQTHFSENKACANGEFTCFSFCELYNVDIKYIEGSIFAIHLSKIAQETRSNSEKNTPYFIQTVLSFLLKIQTNNPGINISVAKLIAKFDDESINQNFNLRYDDNINLTHILYQKVIYDPTEFDFGPGPGLESCSFTPQTKFKSKSIATKYASMCAYKLEKHDYISYPDHNKIYDISMNNNIYDIYENYSNLNFIDMNPYSYLLFNKYMDSKYLGMLDQKISGDSGASKFSAPYLLYNGYGYGYGCESEEREHHIKNFMETHESFVKFCKETNPFYAFVENQTTLIVRENEFNIKLENYTNNLCSKFGTNPDGTWANFVIAGGCIFNCLSNYMDQDPHILETADIDIFFYGSKPDQKKAFNYVLEVIAQDNVVYETLQLSHNSIELTTQNYKKIQLILTEHNTPRGIITQFDLWTSSVFYNGARVLGNLNFIYCIKFWHEKLTGRVLKPKSMLRVAKYMRKGMRMYIKNCNFIEVENLKKTNLTMDLYIDQMVKQKYGDVLHNKYRTVVQEGFIETWFPKFIIKPTALYNFKSMKINMELKSLDTLNQAVINCLIKAPGSHNIPKTTNPAELIKMLKYHTEFYERLTNPNENIPFVLREYSSIVSNIYIGETLDPNCVLDDNFTDFEKLHLLMHDYRKFVSSITCNLFLDGTFTFNDKEIIATNYNMTQAKILGILLNYIKEIIYEINPNIIEMCKNTIKIKYSDVGDFTCDCVNLTGKLHIKYTINNYGSYEITNGFVIVGLFSDDPLDSFDQFVSVLE